MPLSTPIDQKLQDARKVRDELAAALKEKIAALKRDRDELVAEYEEEIGTLDVELRALGVGASGSDHPSDLAVKAYNYLLSHPGERFHGGQLMTAIHAQGAVPSIVLASLLYAGKIKREGERRSTRYFVEQDA